MSQQQCSCSSFKHLEGASVPAYTKAFLEQAGDDRSSEKNRFRCRVCGRTWEKQAPSHEGTRPSLVRID
jgi:rubrerythrin